MRVVVALGGNALLRRGESMSVEVQQRNARKAAAAVAELAADHEVVVTHGNGPQVGLLALQAEAYTDGPRVPLDVLGAESEGLIGYLLDRELSTALPGRRVATLLTQTVVDPAHESFAEPTKPIGPVYERPQGRALAEANGWEMTEDGDGLRRVVPSPPPVAVLEAETVRLLVDHGVLVVCAGGGGVPVARGDDGTLSGVEAVVDKDATSALLAEALGADALLLLTDVDAVYADWPSRDEPVREARADDLPAAARAPGSMGPKVAAAARFARDDAFAAIGSLAQAADVLAGRAGTRITAASDRP